MSRCLPLLTAALLATLSGQRATAAPDCPAIPDPTQRLACFDAAFPARMPSRVIAGAVVLQDTAPVPAVAPPPASAPAPTPVPSATPGVFANTPAPPPSPVGGWQSDSEVAASGFTNVFTWVDAAEQVSCGGQTYRPSLFLRCFDGETAVLLVTDCPVSSLGVGGLVSYQVDNGPTRLRTFIERTDQTALGLWDYGTAQPFLRDIASGGTLKMKYTPKGETRQTDLTFAIGGAAAAIGQIDAACGR